MSSPLPLAGRGWGWGSTNDHFRDHVEPLSVTNFRSCVRALQRIARGPPPPTPPRKGEGSLRPIASAHNFVDARDRSFQSAPCFCQFINTWRLVALFLPSAAASLSP